MTESELAKLLRDNPDLRIAGDLITCTDTTVGASSNAAYVQSAITSEHDLQAAIIAECDRRSLVDSAWGMIAAIPNGQYRKGQRMEAGLRAGLPDLAVLVPRRGYHAAFIELKHGANKPSQAQWEWIGRLNAAGYYAGVVWGYEDAIKILEWYIDCTLT